MRPPRLGFPASGFQSARHPASHFRTEPESSGWTPRPKGRGPHTRSTPCAGYGDATVSARAPRIAIPSAIVPIPLMISQMPTMIASAV
jgi:hypothetical protein